MKIPFLTAAVFAALAVPAAAISPASETFLRGVGIDPQSEPARIADEDGTIRTTYRGDAAEFSLESLVAQNKRNGVLAFVTTRAFIRKLKADYAGTPVPRSNYDALYLTREERGLVGRKIAESVGG